MRESAASRVDLRPSRLAGRLRLVALSLTAAAAAACLLALLQAPSAARLLAAVAALLALLPLPPDRRAAPARQIGVDGTGTVRLFCGDDAAEATPVYCGRLLVCLRFAGGRFPVWADALPGPAWRRLRVACRWPRRGADGPLPPAGSRTK